MSLGKVTETAALLVLAPSAHSYSLAAPAAACADPLELEVYRLRLVDNESAFAACSADLLKVSGAAHDIDVQYRKAYFEQELKFREVELAAYRWQMTAANVVLALVALLTVFGVGFSGYQLWKVSRLSKAPPAGIELELSMSKLRIQTSIIGAVVLFMSYSFLVVFTRDIYTIRKTDQPQTETKVISKP